LFELFLKRILNQYLLQQLARSLEAESCLKIFSAIAIISYS
jgi:hypothetical protein